MTHASVEHQPLNFPAFHPMRSFPWGAKPRTCALTVCGEVVVLQTVVLEPRLLSMNHHRLGDCNAWTDLQTRSRTNMSASVEPFQKLAPEEIFHHSSGFGHGHIFRGFCAGFWDWNGIILLF